MSHIGAMQSKLHLIDKKVRKSKIALKRSQAHLLKIFDCDTSMYDPTLVVQKLKAVGKLLQNYDMSRESVETYGFASGDLNSLEDWHDRVVELRPLFVDLLDHYPEPPEFLRVG